MTRIPLLGLCLAAALLLPACKRGPEAPVDVAPPGRYGDGAPGLAALWGDILLACQKDDRQRVHDLMASTMLSKEELAGLLGPDRGAALWPRYEALLGSLANVGAIELVAQVYEKKYDDIAVVRVDELPEGERQPTDRQVLAALRQQVPLYTVRVKRKTEAKGLRYDFFVYLKGRWRTGNQLGKYLAPAEKAPPAVAPSAPGPAGGAGPAGPAPAKAPGKKGG